MLSYSSNYYPSMTDYHTPPPTINDSYYNSQSTYQPTTSLTNTYSNYYSSNQAYFSNQISTTYVINCIIINHNLLLILQ